MTSLLAILWRVILQSWYVPLGCICIFIKEHTLLSNIMSKCRFSHWFWSREVQPVFHCDRPKSRAALFSRTSSVGQGSLMHLLSCLWWHGSGGRPPFIGHVIHRSSWGPAQRLTRIKHSFTNSVIYRCSKAGLGCTYSRSVLRQLSCSFYLSDNLV